MDWNLIGKMIWLFFIYSFLGWIFEVSVAAVKQKRFVNKGLIDGPFCISYGFCMVLISMSDRALTGFWLFVFTTVWATAVEWVAGHIIEHFYHERWWDYSEKRWNLDGYICVSVSLLWGVLGYVSVTWGNKFILQGYDQLPEVVRNIILILLLLFLATDCIASVIIQRGKSGRLHNWEEANNFIAQVTQKMILWISKRFQKRIQRAYPKASKVEHKEETVFAEGCSLYKIIILFVVGALLGDIVETIFCKVTAGVWMSRSSVVWGPFSIVWGLAISAITLFLYRYKDRSDGFLFIIGTFLGGAYEYICSVFTEVFFGKVFWDYSHIPFNIGGRVNLMYSLFWGIATVVWFKLCYPSISKMIERIPLKPGKIITWTFVVFMCCNIAMSSVALIRYDQRGKGEEADTQVEQWVDHHYDDARMQRIYPNATQKE